LVLIEVGGARLCASVASHARAARRVRLEIRGLERNPAAVPALEQHFARMPGIVLARSYTLIFRVLLC
jgi:hypothetical protein